MKNVKMLLLPAVMVVNVADAFRLKDYTVGSRIDKKGRTIYHITAENCDDLERLAVRLAFEAVILAHREPNLQVAQGDPSILTKDNQGRTALDIAEKKYEETGHSDCMKLIVKLREKMKEAEKEEQEQKEKQEQDDQQIILMN